MVVDQKWKWNALIGTTVKQFNKPRITNTQSQILEKNTFASKQAVETGEEDYLGKTFKSWRMWRGAVYTHPTVVLVYYVFLH